MKRVINCSNLGAFGAKVGDCILDTKTGKKGIVVKEGQSGNYGLIYVDFGNGAQPRKINPLDDAQRFGRYQICKSPVTSSWLGSSSNRRYIEKIIEDGCTWEDIVDYLEELEDQGMSPEDSNMLRIWAREEYNQAVNMKFE